MGPQQDQIYYWKLKGERCPAKSYREILNRIEFVRQEPKYKLVKEKYIQTFIPFIMEWIYIWISWNH